MPSGKHLIDNGVIFQCDYDPKHTANAHKNTISHGLGSPKVWIICIIETVWLLELIPFCKYNLNIHLSFE